MREFKFRVWDGEKMINTPLSLWGGYAIGLCEENGKLVKVNGPAGMESYEKTDHVLMQYTGLKDKNGAEIYEGDLIKNKSGRICEVRWNQGHGMFDAEVRVTIGGCNPIGFRTSNWTRYITVIGNIYQNPELLGG